MHPLRLVLLSPLLLALAFGASAQAPEASGGCAVGTATAELDRSGVRATLFTNGAFFRRAGFAEGVYEVPRGSEKTALYIATLWVGGEVDGGYRVAGTQYSPYEYWPGPLDASGATTAARCAQFDQLWEVRHSDLVAYSSTGSATSDLAAWPIAQGAPFFVDLDGDDRRDPATEPRIELGASDAGYSPDLGSGRQIDLSAGERPDLVGDEAIWWMMNDAGNDHTWLGTDPLGIEVRVLAYSTPSPEAGLDHATFYEITVTNRSAEPIVDSRVSLFADFALGNFADDYFGGDDARDMMVAYNGLPVDNGHEGYGESPPALGFDLLSGASGALLEFDVDAYPEGVRNTQRNRWPDGQLIRRGGNGFGGTGEVTSWLYDGDAVRYAYWSAEKIDADTSVSDLATNRRGVINAPAQTLASGESRRVDLALLFAEGGETDGAPRSRLRNVSRLRDISDAVQAAYDARGSAGLRDAVVSYTEPPPPPPAAPLRAPAAGVDFDAQGRPATITFRWDPVAGADIYLLQLSTTPSFSHVLDQGVQTHETSATLPVDRVPSDPGTRTGYWRVVPATWGSAASGAEVRSYRLTPYVPGFASFEVVANAAGAVVPPEAAALPSAGFPTPGGNAPSEAQQTNGTRWLISSGGRADFAAFVDRVLRGGGNAGFVYPFDFEVRFTGSSLAFRGFQDFGKMEVPFELWNIGIGTPEDPSDDVRMIPIVLDVDEDGVFDLSALDSPISDGDDDPESDWFYWFYPNDRSPGEVGYLAWETTRDAAQIANEALARMTFVGWDLGAAPPYAAPLPEPGSVFRILTANPIPIADEPTPERSPLALSVHPNPARGLVSVPYRLEASGEIRLSVVDVLGREVSVLASGARAVGEHRAVLDTSRLAAGVYVVRLDAEGARASQVLTVVR